MKKKCKSKSDWISEKLDEIHNDIKEVREKDIPNLKIDLAVVKERSSTYAKLISAVGGIIAVAISSAIAWFK
jgi:hypothetical protein